MTTLVIGGTGTVGSNVVRELLARGEKVVVMTHSPEKTKALPAGAKGVVANLREPASLGKAFAGVDAVFLVTAWAEDETVQGLAGVEAAKASSARRIVYLSIHKLEVGPHIPHFASKFPIERAVKESGKEWTILRPNNFFQNDFWLRDTIMKYGVYPQPIGNIGLSRVDVRDVAEAAAKALTQPDHKGAVYPLVGPDVCTGENTAATYSRYLGRQIRYGGGRPRRVVRRSQESVAPQTSRGLPGDARALSEIRVRRQRRGIRPAGQGSRPPPAEL